MSINNKFNGRDFEINEDVAHIYPIIQSIRNEYDIDKEMAKHSVKHSWKNKLEKM